MKFLLFIMVVIWVVSCSASNDSTTPHIYEVFMGNCYVRNPSTVNCSALWEAFSEAAVIDNKVANIDDYEEFFALANFSCEPNRALFWSGNMEVAVALSRDGDSYTMIEETSTGYIIDGLKWCGLPSPNGSLPNFDYVNSCPYIPTNSSFGTQEFWNKSSHMFAVNAVGAVNVLLQPVPLYKGGPLIAVRSTSIFYITEFPSMDTSKVTSMRIMVLKNTTDAPNEVCGSGSLASFSQEVYNKFMFYPTCVDDPQELVNILCEGETTAAECILAVFSSNSQPQPVIPPEVVERWAVSMTVLLFVSLVIIFMLLGYLYYGRLKEKMRIMSPKFTQLQTPLLDNIESDDEPPNPQIIN